MMIKASSSFADSKQHYKILDGLRGVAAILVVIFHIYEVYSGGDHTKQFINHGYLAVDFFFVLSGFVIGHAYDDRWNGMTLKNFFTRRLIRLHPMIIVGMTVGAICFYFGASAYFPLITDTSIGELALLLLLGYFLIPVSPALDIRGWHEMYPLNGPAWTLFFEYIANILYALILRKLPTKILALLTIIAGAALLHMAVTSPNGDIIGGWSVEPAQLRIGFTRLLYPFLAGLLLSRVIKPGQVRNAFLWSTLLLVVIMSFPRVGGHGPLWANGLYDALTIILLFPVIVYIGASGKIESGFGQRACTFLGDISYPIYITHFPLLYVFYAWVTENDIPMNQGIIAGLGVLALSILLAYATMKWVDEPVRKWLAQRFLKKSS